ncbi:MAG TPA: pseudaminic acid synthase [Caulobacteraceae bacterium]|nr:pseudaminic acid synthase [Caulobacteraceae bacterium]
MDAEFAIAGTGLVKPFAIAGRAIGPAYPPLVIAELSGNHNGELDRALRLVDAAADAGAEAVKLQTYTADTITLDHDGPDFRIAGGLWDGRSLHALYGEAHTPFEWHEALFAHARARGLMVFSSPFDETAVALLESLDAPAYKIASFEAVDLALIGAAAATGKPLIISTGMTNADEIGAAVGAARAAGSGGVALLHCVSDYPARYEAANLRTVGRLAADFDCVTGLSDHTPGTAASVAAVALGAAIIEKHVTLARADGGPDAAFSLEPDELARLIADCRHAWEALGEATYARGAAETANKQFRRSLYVVRDVAAGTVLTAADVRSIRPGYGLAPVHLPQVLGRRAARDLKRGERFGWEMVELAAQP